MMSGKKTHGSSAQQLAERQRKGMVGCGLAPTPERLRHGPVVRKPRLIEDKAAAPMVWQGLDTLAIMLARGSINEAMKKAGDCFHDHFRRAGLDGLRAADPTRVPVHLRGSGVFPRHHGSEAARLQIHSALDALGGMLEPGGSCAWYVLGCEMSLKRWALTANWASRRIDHVVASGILIADLGILRAHWAF
jgi:hypothetical protein